MATHNFSNEKFVQPRLAVSAFRTAQTETSLRLAQSTKDDAQASSFVDCAPLRDRLRTSRSRSALKKLLNVIVNHIATPEELGPGVKLFQ